MKNQVKKTVKDKKDRKFDKDDLAALEKVFKHLAEENLPFLDELHRRLNG